MRGTVLHTTLLVVVGVATAVHAWDHDEHTVLARRAAIVALDPDAGLQLGADAHPELVFTSPAGFSIDIADPIHLLTFLFGNQTVPPAPFPDCDTDPSADLLECQSAGNCL